MKKIITSVMTGFLLLIFLQSAVFGQNRIVYHYTEDLPKVLANVRYARVLIPGISHFDVAMQKAFLNDFRKYLGIKRFRMGITNDPCDFVTVEFGYQYGRLQIKDLFLDMLGCDGLVHRIYVGDMLVQMHRGSKGEMKSHTLRLRDDVNKFKALKLAKPERWNESSLKTYFDSSENLKSYEGIYEQVSSGGHTSYRLALVEVNGLLKLIYLSGAGYYHNRLWFTGDTKATFLPNTNDQNFLANYHMLEKSTRYKSYIQIERGKMTIDFFDHDPSIYIKTFPRN